MVLIGFIHVTHVLEKQMCKRQCLKPFVMCCLSSLNNVKMPYHRMTKHEIYEAIGMLRNMSVNDVARHFNVNRSTIFRLKVKENRTGDVVDIRKSVRP